MSFHILNLKVTGILVENNAKVLSTEVYENYMSDKIDFWSGNIKTITQLDFESIDSIDDTDDLWEFIEKNSQYLTNLESISFTQPLGRGPLIDRCHVILVSFDVKIEQYETCVVYKFQSTGKKSLGHHLTVQTITSIY